jgi:hypothetical protein
MSSSFGGGDQRYSVAQDAVAVPAEPGPRVRDTGPVANGGTGILSAGTLGAATPDAARRTWPQWFGLGFVLIAVAVPAVFWDAAGARLLVGALGAFFLVRGIALFRTAGSLTEELAGRARTLGSVAVLGGVAAIAAAVASGTLAARVLFVAVPVVLVGAVAALLSRGGVARRGGVALLVWSLLVTGLLVGTGLAQGWERAADVATVVAALAVAAFGVSLLIGAGNLRQVASRPAPAPVRPSACAGCACGAGGCGA